MAAVSLLKERLASRTQSIMAVDLEGNLGGSKWTKRHIATLQIGVDGEGDDPPLLYVFDTHMAPEILTAHGEDSLRSLLENAFLLS